MAKEIKGFEVWRPPPPPADEPLSRERPPCFLLGIDINKNKYDLTLTGVYWLLLPWLFFITKRLQFTLLEGLLGLVAFASAMGAAIRCMVAGQCPLILFVFFSYLLFHLFAACFSHALYLERSEPEYLEYCGRSRTLQMFFNMLVLRFRFIWLSTFARVKHYFGLASLPSPRYPAYCPFAAIIRSAPWPRQRAADCLKRSRKRRRRFASASAPSRRARR